MIERIQKMMAEISTLQAHNSEEVEALRIKYLSKKGEISALMADFRTVPADMKKELGMKLNELKNAALEKINSLKSNAATEEAAGPQVDLTRTPYPIALGTRPPPRASLALALPFAFDAQAERAEVTSAVTQSLFCMVSCT